MVLPAVVLDDSFRDIALPEAKLDHDVTGFWSIFPNIQLLEKSLIQLKSCLYSAEKCHAWLVEELPCYFFFTDIGEIGCDEDLIW